MDWEGIRTAILDVERRRLGLPSREELATKRAIESRAQAAHESQMESADLLREKTQQDMALQPELTRLRSETALAQADAAKARAEREPNPTGPAAIATMDPAQFAEYVKRQKMVADATRAPEGTRPKIDPDEIAATAEDWLAGRAQPSTQAARGAASAYIRAKGKTPPRLMGQVTWDSVAQGESTLSKLDDIETLAGQMKDAFGPLNFTINELRQRMPGLEADPRFAVIQTLLRNAQNLEIKRITGAQMSEAEAARLIRGMMDGTVRFDEFISKLKVMKRNVNRDIYAAQGRTQDFIKDFPLEDLTPIPNPDGTVPGVNAPTRRVVKGVTYEKHGDGKWYPVQ